MVGWCSMGTFNDPCWIWLWSDDAEVHQCTPDLYAEDWIQVAFWDSSKCLLISSLSGLNYQQICVGRNPLWKNATMNVVEAGWTEGIWGNMREYEGMEGESPWICHPVLGFFCQILEILMHLMRPILGHAEPQMLWGLDEYGVLGASVARGAGWSLCCSGATKKLSEGNEKNHKGSSCSYYAPVI